MVIVSAGNGGRNNSQGIQGYGTITAPGNDPYVITVGAVNTKGTTDRGNDVITSYSSKSPTTFHHFAKPDIVAPGNKIVSTLPAGLTLSNEFPQNQVSPDCFSLSGTSMATPVVSSAAALMLQQNPSLTPDQIKARLMRTATKKFPQFSVNVDPDTNIPYTSYYDIFTVGAGYLDIRAAMNDTTVSTGYALSPTAIWNPTKGQIYLSGVDGQNVVCGANVVWGNGASVSDMTQIVGEP